MLLPEETEINNILRISISTQIGCNVGCNFCKFGKDFTRNLTFEEMKSQIDSTIENVKDENYTSVVVDTCGSGEPILNWKNVEQIVEYCKSLNYTFNLYTVGVEYPDIYNRCLNLAIRYPNFNIYFNIISISDIKRNEKIKNHNLYYYRLEKLANYCFKFKHNSGRKAHIIYHIDGNELLNDINIIKNKFSQTIFDVRILHDDISVEIKNANLEKFKEYKLEESIEINYPNDVVTNYEQQFYSIDGKI